jgi:TolB protein
MWKIISLLLPFLLFSQELEVRLATRSNLRPIYLASFEPKELKTVLEFDLNTNGYSSVVDSRDDLEATFQSPFDRTLWKKEKIPFCLSTNVVQNKLEVTLFNAENGTSKKYMPMPLERQALHRLSDAIQKDLFGKEGIAALRLIYTVRNRNKTEKGLEWLSEIWVSDSDGANAKQITSEKSYCLSPYFLPNRPHEFFYVSEKTGQSKIYRATLSDPKGELMVDLRGNQALPSLSRKGTQMAFITDVAGRPDLFIQNFTEQGSSLGKARQLFSSARATQATPTFSPDGKQLAFVSDKDGPPRIYLIAVGNGRETKRPHPQLLTKKNRENTSPAWSPDGTKLAYSAKVEGVRQIWIYDFQTQEEFPLTTSPENKENPSWAPDSFHLVYNTESEESCELFLTHLNGAEPVQITKGPGQKRFASWEPR